MIGIFLKLWTTTSVNNKFSSFARRICLHILSFPSSIFFMKVVLQILAKITDKREAPIAEPSFWRYQLPLHLKLTFVTARLSWNSSVDFPISGLVSIEKRHRRVTLMTSERGTLIFVLLTSIDTFCSYVSNSRVSSFCQTKRPEFSILAPGTLSFWKWSQKSV